MNQEAKDILYLFEGVCRKNKWSSRQAAKNLGVDHSNYNKVLNKKRKPSNELLGKMARMIIKYTPLGTNQQLA